VPRFERISCSGGMAIPEMEWLVPEVTSADSRLSEEEHGLCDMGMLSYAVLP
jgi:hypothetical protein